MTDVERPPAGPVPPIPPIPPGAAGVFGERVGLAAAYVELLADTGISHGLLGPREVPRLWDRHVLNCAVVAELIEADATCADVGSGAGLPGLALAIARPDVTMHLIEPLSRRARWLETTIAALDLRNVTVHCCRAEALHSSFMAAVVTARAVANLTTLGEWCLPLVSPGGRVLAIKGSKAEEELGAAWPTLRKCGVASAVVRECGVGVVDPPTRVVDLATAASS